MYNKGSLLDRQPLKGVSASSVNIFLPMLPMRPSSTNFHMNRAPNHNRRHARHVIDSLLSGSCSKRGGPIVWLSHSQT